MEITGQFNAPTALPPGKGPQNPLDRKLGGPPESVLTLWRIEKFCTAGNRTQAVQSVAMPTPRLYPFYSEVERPRFNFIIAINVKHW
jgi:hypothetical protein